MKDANNWFRQRTLESKQPRSRYDAVTTSPRHYVCCRAFDHVSTGTKSITIAQRLSELYSKTEWHIFMADSVYSKGSQYIHSYSTVSYMFPLFTCQIAKAI